MNPRTHVQILAEFAHNTGAGVSKRIASDVNERILDVIGNSLAGRAESSGESDPDRATERIVTSWGGSETSGIIGSRTRVPTASAALVNGTLAHILDFDDTHLPSVLHPSSSVIPAALAVAEEVGATPEALVSAIAAGIEICNRLGMASYLPEEGNSIFFEKGFHATSICGTLGAAVSAGLLYGLDANGIADAIGIAASMGAGIIEANRTGGTVKRIHCGWAAHGGVVAALMAREGITGPPTVLEGRFGFFNAYLDGKYDEGALLDDLGSRWELLRTSYKPYPTNHFTHPGIDCALALRAEGLVADDVAEIELGVAEPVIRTIGEPIEEKQHPRSSYHAKFSGPYTLAAALIGGGGLGIYLDDFADGVWDDPVRLDLASKVKVFADERATRIFPNAFAAVVRVKTRGGSMLEKRVDASRGSANSPLSHEEILTKFRLNASRLLDGAVVDRLITLSALKTTSDFHELLQLVQR